MKKNNTREIFEIWRDFQKNESLLRESSRNNKNQRIIRLENLVKIGDELEYIINENVDNYILESFYLNEGIVSSFRKIKDKVKDFLSQGWTRDKLDDKGNRIKINPEDSDEVALYEKEYTKKTKALIGLLLVAKIAAVAMGGMNFHVDNPGASQSNSDTTYSMQMSNPDNLDIKNVIIDTLKNSGIPDIPEPSKADLAAAESMVDEKIDIDVFNAPEFEIKGHVEDLVKSTIKTISDKTGESKEKIEKKIEKDKGLKSQIQDLVKDLSQKAESEGLDTSGTYDYSINDIKQIVDATKANQKIQKLVKTAFDAMKSSNSYSHNVAGENFDYKNMDQSSLNNIHSFTHSTDSSNINILVHAAKVHAIKKLLDTYPDLFKKANHYSEKVQEVEGGDSEKDISKFNFNMEGSEEAKILNAIYKSLEDNVIKMIKLDKINIDSGSGQGDLKLLNKFIDKIEGEISSSLEANGISGKIKNSIVKYFTGYIVHGMSSPQTFRMINDNFDSFNHDFGEILDQLGKFGIEYQTSSISKG